MPEMVEVTIDSIRVSLMSQQRLVILRETKADRYLVIWIGLYEAEAITMAMQGVEVARPLTWDLLKNIFGDLNARIVRVEVVDLRDDTFFGSIVVEVNGRILEIDSRPSDALALAVRAHVPIYVSRTVMASAGITPEDDLQQKAAQLPPAPLANPPTDAHVGGEGAEEGEDRLSIFEDFLEHLNKGDKEDDADADNEEKKE